MVKPMDAKKDSKVEFSEWITPFTDSNLTIMEVVYGNGGLHIECHLKTKEIFKQNPIRKCAARSLSIRVFNEDDKSIYQVECEDIWAFRYERIRV